MDIGEATTVNATRRQGPDGRRFSIPKGRRQHMETILSRNLTVKRGQKISC